MVSRHVTQTTHWLQASRPLAQVNIAVPLLLGQAAAWNENRKVHVSWLVASLVWGVLDHLAIVFANDYADRDADSGSRTLISGGSGVLPEGKLEPSSIRLAAILSATALLAWSITLALAGRPFAPVYAAIALALLWLYSFPPARMSYRGGGELLQGVGMGVGLPSFGYYLQGQGYVAPLWVLAPAVIVGICANVLSALPDIPDDERAQKRTWPVRFGANLSKRVAVSGIALSAFAVFLWTPGIPVALRALAGCVPMLPLLIASRQSTPFGAAFWGSVGAQALLVGWGLTLAAS
ncbi:MAG: prenyltransferase [Myxococcota bacterium]